MTHILTYTLSSVAGNGHVKCMASYKSIIKGRNIERNVHPTKNVLLLFVFYMPNPCHTIGSVVSSSLVASLSKRLPIELF